MYDEDNRIVTRSLKIGDVDNEMSLRPKWINEYIGQEKVKNKLNIVIQAAKKRNESLDHVLLYGPLGLGKTTLANIIANEIGVNIRVTSGPAIERPGDLASILINYGEDVVLIIDDIHVLNRSVEVILYADIKNIALDIIIGKSLSDRSVRISFSKFTFIEATTR